MTGIHAVFMKHYNILRCYKCEDYNEDIIHMAENWMREILEFVYDSHKLRRTLELQAYITIVNVDMILLWKRLLLYNKR